MHAQQPGVLLLLLVVFSAQQHRSSQKISMLSGRGVGRDRGGWGERVLFRARLRRLSQWQADDFVGGCT